MSLTLLLHGCGVLAAKQSAEALTRLQCGRLHIFQPHVLRRRRLHRTKHRRFHRWQCEGLVHSVPDPMAYSRGQGARRRTCGAAKSRQAAAAAAASCCGLCQPLQAAAGACRSPRCVTFCSRALVGSVWEAACIAILSAVACKTRCGNQELRGSVWIATALRNSRCTGPMKSTRPMQGRKALGSRRRRLDRSPRAADSQWYRGEL